MDTLLYLGKLVVDVEPGCGVEAERGVRVGEEIHSAPTADSKHTSPWHVGHRETDYLVPT